MDVIERPLRLYCDNKLSILYYNKNRSSIKSNILTPISWFLNKQYIVASCLLSTLVQMVSNPLSKGPQPKIFHDHTAHMSVISIDDI